MIREIKNLTIPISDADMDQLFEGDIEKTPNLMKMLRKSNLLKRDTTSKIWDNGIFPYIFHKDFHKNNGNNLNPCNDRSFCLELTVSFFQFLSSFLPFYYLNIYLIVTLSRYLLKNPSFVYTHFFLKAYCL